MNLDPTAIIIAYSAAWLLGFILFVLLWIFIIRTAVLSALRKHHAETQAERRAAAGRVLPQ
ncbi:hypothetical protein [Plantibacter sp. T3]|uniref:hypothetical protein n=1 Tax=Plantibacter sp. T3 TaxID=2653161 RepID=UPI0012F0F48F|nr:hypothetical protein [Plantibacter sp. T3]VXB07816.1 conserved hypothetical protein [Plantibacter sp. T3]